MRATYFADLDFPNSIALINKYIFFVHLGSLAGQELKSLMNVNSEKKKKTHGPYITPPRPNPQHIGSSRIVAFNCF
jgi:hypothetical protein